jgi:hypothetical protein
LITAIEHCNETCGRSAVSCEAISQTKKTWNSYSTIIRLRRRVLVLLTLSAFPQALLLKAFPLAQQAR